MTYVHHGQNQQHQGAAGLSLPANVEAEQSLLGSLLINNDVFAIVAPLVQRDDFSEEIHRRIFEIAASLISNGTAATPITIKPFLGDHQIGDLTLKQYLARLVADAAMPLHARSNAVAIRDLATRRRLISIFNDAAAQALDAPVAMKPTQIAGEAASLLFEIASVEGPQTTRMAAHEGAAEVIEHSRKLRNREIRDDGATTGLPDLDRATGGYRPGALWIVGARPGVGKTVFAVTSSVKTARAGWGVKAFSLEVAQDQMHARILADMVFDPHHPVSFKDILRGSLTDTDFVRLDRAREELRRLPLVVDTASRLSVSEIRIKVRSERERMDADGIALRAVFVDYLKMVSASDRYRGQRHYEVGEISAGLKQIAKDERVCIVLLAQLNRTLEGRENKRPGLADLRESGDLEADADVVAFLHRESMFIRQSPAFQRGEDEALIAYAENENKAELILGKNRAGETGTFHLFCNVACSSMASMARDFDQ